MNNEPFVDRMKDHVSLTTRRWHRWLAVGVLLVLLGFSVLSFVGWRQSESTTRDVRGESAGLKRELRPIDSEKSTGEVFNTLRKKPIGEVEDENPFRKAISAASAKVEVVIASADQFDGAVRGCADYLAFGKGSQALLLASSTQCRVRPTAVGEVTYRGAFAMDSGDPAVGRPVSFLKEAEYLQIRFELVPANSKILKGKVIWTFNDAVDFEFAIPPQTTLDGRIFIRDLDKLRQTIAEADI